MIALRLLGRLLLASLGLFLAGLAAAATVFLGLRQLYAPVAGAGQGPEALLDAGLYALAAALALGRFSLVIAAAAIVIAEAARLRSWLYYAAAGLLSAGYALSTLAPAAPEANGTLRETAVFVAAGLAGGLVYWLVAGRRAGIRAPRGPA